MDAEGFLYFIGRDDDMIKVSGYRISPTEVEEISARFDTLTELAAVGVAHPVSGQAIVLVVRQNAQHSLTSDSIRAACQAQFPAYMVPGHIQIEQQDLPRNPNGKIDRKALQLRFSDFFYGC
jgi:acyl-coenzyme A synthetase/AMP-(fatty) acid ligase